MTSLSEPAEKARLDAWIAQRQEGQADDPDLLRALAPGARSTTRRPSVSTYTKALKAFKKKYGSPFDISPWNEVNVCQAQGPHGGPAGEDLQVGHRAQARRAVLLGRRARSSRAARSSASTSSTATTSAARSATCASSRSYAKPHAQVLGHPQLQRHQPRLDSRTTRLIKEIGYKRAEIWLTETGGQLGCAALRGARARRARPPRR